MPGPIDELMKILIIIFYLLRKLDENLVILLFLKASQNTYICINIEKHSFLN